MNQVLTSTYNALYADDDDESEVPAQLHLHTAPLSATQEITQLFGAGIVDLDSVLPAALNALGASADEITKAQERAKKRQEAADALPPKEAAPAQPQVATATSTQADAAASRPASEAGDRGA